MNHNLDLSASLSRLGQVFADVLAEGVGNPKAIDPIDLFTLFYRLLLIGITVKFLVGKWRGRNSDDVQGTHELLTNFRELHAKGELSDVEYRTIKTQLAAKLQAELKQRPPDPPPVAETPDA